MKRRARRAPSLEGYFASLASKVRPATLRGPRAATRRVMDVVSEVVFGFDGSLSTRQVYYQLVSRGVVENTGASYDRVQRMLVKMRRDELIPFEKIVDRNRAKHQLAGWDGAAAMMDQAHRQYRRNLWAQQPLVVMVAIEKAALEGVFAEVVDEYGAQLWTIRGFNSESFAFEWATEINRITEWGQRVLVLYFGDFDPSGLAIEHDAIEKLKRHGAAFEWQRCGLLWDDFDAFDLVRVPVKRSDSRAARFVDYFGDRAAELDALPPQELRARVRSVLAGRIDREVWDQGKRTEAAERESLGMVAANWNAALRAASGGPS